MTDGSGRDRDNLQEAERAADEAGWAKDGKRVKPSGKALERRDS